MLSAGCEKDTKPEEPAATGSALSSGKVASGASVAAKPAPPPKQPPEPLNVLMLTIDSLRADVPWQGYDRPIAPNLTKLAEKAVVYENHRSVSSYTAQTVATWLSGRYASTLYRTGWFFTGYSEANQMMPELLQAEGVRTLSVQAHMYFGRNKGLSQGFDVWETVPGITFDAQTDRHVTSHKVTKRLIELLSEPDNTSKQFFVWSHYMDPHDVYTKHEESPDFGNKNRDRYDSEVWYTDKWIGELLDFCKKQPWWKKTALIITSDHGEAFGDHDMYKHAFEIWDVLTRVPLLVLAPGAEPQRISAARTHIDLAPTVMELMGKRPPDSFMGQSLVSEIYGKQPAKERDVIVMELAEDSHNPWRRAIVKGDYKLIVFDKGWQKLLFNLKKDPGEKHDLSKEEPEKFEQMLKLFEQTFENIPSVEPAGGMKLRSGRIAKGVMSPPKEEKKAKEATQEASKPGEATKSIKAAKPAEPATPQATTPAGVAKPETTPKPQTAPEKPAKETSAAGDKAEP